MKNSYKYFLILITIIICSIQSYGQSDSLAVDAIHSWPSNPISDSNNVLYSFTIRVRNYSTTTNYTGQLSIAYKTYQKPLNGSNMVDSVQVTINANDTADFSVTGFVFDTTAAGAFRLGGNVVVVWPYSSNGTSITLADTFKTSVTVTTPAGIHDYNEYNKMEVYPVPTSDIINFRNLSPEKTFEYVRITDVLGRQEYYSAIPKTAVNISFLLEGIYFIELKEKNQPARIAKFIIRR
jgi:hypothetical protein